MSTNTIFLSGAIAVISLAGLSVAVSADAQSSRYGGSVYDYESGQSCGQACAAPAPVATTSRYGSPVQSAPPVYVDCRAMGTCAPPAPVYAQQPTTVYTQPAPVQSYSQNTYAPPVNCPAGTTAQPDGTCMQSSYSAPSTSYSTGSTYSSGSTYSAPTTTYSEPVSCPAGTTAQSDGTCMQTGSSYSSGSTYSAPSTSYSSSGSSYGSSSSYSSASGGTADCPAGTSMQSDGTCMQGGSSTYSSASSYTGSSVELYTGDATTTSATTPAYGYTSDGGYGSTDYLPIRK